MPPIDGLHDISPIVPILVGEQKRAGTDARGRSSGLAACMSPAHHDDVILLSHHDQYLVTSRCLRHT